MEERISYIQCTSRAFIISQWQANANSEKAWKNQQELVYKSSEKMSSTRAIDTAAYVSEMGCLGFCPYKSAPKARGEVDNAI